MAQLVHPVTGKATVVGVTHTLIRGDHNNLVVEHGFLEDEITRVTFTARKKGSADLGEGDPVLSLPSDAYPDQWTHEDYKSTLEFLDGDTKTLTSANSEFDLYFDTEVTPNNYKEFTVEVGTFEIVPDSSHDSQNAVNVSPGTRQDYDTQLAELAALLDVSWLSVAAASGATSITVVDVSTLDVAVTDDIKVYLTMGGSDTVTITAISGNTITFAGDSLTSDAAKGNVVEKV